MDLTQRTESGAERLLVVRTAQLTDVGRVRSENQDFAILSSDEEELGGRGRLMVVADGMGGHRGGATASRLAAVTIKSEYYSSSLPESDALKRALEKANSKIFAEAQANPDLRGMGTTCSALVIRGDRAYFAHVGDSRIYLIRAGEIRQLTEDHSLVASMVREGLLTSQEAEVHPRRNVLQRSIGVGEQVEVDVQSGLKVEAGDTFILCSDGLHGLVKGSEMMEVAKMPVEEAAREFVKRAMERGAPDNVTVIVARVEEASASEAAELRARMATARTIASEEPVKTLEVLDPFDDGSAMPTMKFQAITEEMLAPAPEQRTTDEVAAPEEVLMPPASAATGAVAAEQVAAASPENDPARTLEQPVTEPAVDEHPVSEPQPPEPAPAIEPPPKPVGEDTIPTRAAAAAGGLANVVPPPVIPAPAAAGAAAVAAAPATSARNREPQPAERKGGALKWIVILLLLVAAIGAGYVYYTRSVGVTPAAGGGVTP